MSCDPLISCSHDLDMVVTMYRINRLDPAIDRDSPPVAGRIAWSRQLLRRVTQPMEVFQCQENCLTTLMARRVIRQYNYLAKVLVEYEMLYHRGWLRQVRRPTAEVVLYWIMLRLGFHCVFNGILRLTLLYFVSTRHVALCIIFQVHFMCFTMSTCNVVEVWVFAMSFLTGGGMQSRTAIDVIGSSPRM